MQNENTDIVSFRPNYSYVYFSFVGIWLLVTFLYSLHLSSILGKVNVGVAYTTGLLVPIFFSLGYGYASVLFNRKVTDISPTVYLNIPKLISRTKILSFFFFSILALEFAIMGYVPLLKMLFGGGVSHFEFGIPSVHGLMMSFGALLATTWFLVFYTTKKRIALFWMLAIIFLFVLLVTRKMMIVSVAQISLIAIVLAPNKKILYRIPIFAILVIIVFGWIGDIRTGRELFLRLSHFQGGYPEWLPTGFGWVYIYITSPLANLTNFIGTDPIPMMDLSFAQNLLPSVIRGMFFETVKGFFQFDWQVSGAFNIATGLRGTYASLGPIGMYSFLFLVGFTLKYIIVNSKNLKFFLLFVVFSQCAIFLIFSNNFFNLNTASQMFFLLIIYNEVKIVYK